MKNLIARLTGKIDRGLVKLVPNAFIRPNFAILSSPRSGSTLLVELLDLHPSILCHSELYENCGIYHRGKFSLVSKENAVLIFLMNQFPLCFLKLFWSLFGRRDSVGFKMLYYQSRAVLSFVLTRPETKKIVLYRRNFLRKELSHQIASSTGEWYQHSEEVKKHRILFDIDRFHRRHKQVRSEESKVEFILKENINKIYEFIGVEGLDVDLSKLRIRRQNPYPIKDLVTNYDEIKAELADTEHAWMLDDENELKKVN